MGGLPRKAQAFLYLMCGVGLISALLATRLPSTSASVPVWEIALFAVLATVAGGIKVSLSSHRRTERAGSMSLGFAITFAALLHLGPAWAVWVGVASCLSSCLYPKRQPVHQLAFNVSLTALEALCAGLAFTSLGGLSFAHEGLRAFPAVAGACLTYFVVNTGGVATIIGLCGGQSILGTWRDCFLWTAPGYFGAAGVASLCVYVLSAGAGLTLLFASPVAYLTYYSYAIYTARANEKQEHIEELQVSQSRLSDLYLATIKSLAIAIDAKDQFTHQHILRVGRYAVATARQMGLSGAELHAVETGALLHDIGKLGVPEYVLLKPGRLTEEEFAKIRKHPEIGAAILDPVDFPWPVVPVVRYHHERWDGTGYPEGLKGEAIPLAARILAVADVYDALTSLRSYRQAWSHDQAVALVRRDAGTHFDPRVAEAFLAVVDQVIAEMAASGEGPLALDASAVKPAPTKADQAVLDIQRASAELWALYEVVQTLSCSLGMQETLDILARKLETILPGTACVFLLHADGEAGLVARAAVGVNREFFHGCRTLGASGPTVRALLTGQSYLGHYDPEDLMLVGSRMATWVPLQTTLIVPIVHQGEALGTINVYHPQARAFGQHELHFLEAIAERAAMALANSLLFERARGHALTDPLTGLYNVRFVTDHVNERCQARRDGRQLRPAELDDAAPASAYGVALRAERDEQTAGRAVDALALLCLDVDSFKPINDNFGHQKGDDVLQDLGRLFRSTVREGDVVARYGGDEFLIVLEGGQSQAEAMAARLHAAVDAYDPGLVHDRLGPLHMGVSIGCAVYPQDGSDFASLLSAADGRMYADKTERKLGRMAANGRTNGHTNGYSPETVGALCEDVASEAA